MVDSSKNTVQSITKAFAVLRAFDVGRPELTITEAAGRAGLDRGTTYRLLHTLVELGYVATVPGSRRFRLTLNCLELGYSALATGGLKAQAAPLLRELVPDPADAASLGVLDGAEVVYLERVQTDMGPRTPDRRVGSRTGAYAAALGHAILAWQPPDVAHSVLASAERVPLSERTLTDLDTLLDRLREVRTQGYAVSDGENAYGLRTVAAPVFAPDGAPLAGVSLTIRSERMPLDAFVAEAVPPLLKVTDALTAAARLTSASAPTAGRLR